MFTNDCPLVSVIVPAWNADATLRASLESAAAQTHDKLEILIVDDGSSDDTATVASEFCISEPRARLIRQHNAGVAAARNRAIEEARGDFIALLDADDLWHAEKIKRQLDTFRQSSSRTGLVYCWYRMIDEVGNVCERPWAPVMEGNIFEQHLSLNFGTGSAPLISRGALGTLRYESALQEAGNQGCEDWLLQLQIASQFEIACTRAFLVGYRIRPRAMSSDKARMIRSQVQMYEILLGEVSPSRRKIVEGELARLRQGSAVPKWHRLTARNIVSRLRTMLLDKELDGQLGSPFKNVSPT